MHGYQRILFLIFFMQGKNNDVLKELKKDIKSGEGFVITFHEAFECAKSTKIHPTLKYCYVELILVMFVAVGDNRSFLDHLCYSFVRFFLLAYCALAT